MVEFFRIFLEEDMGIMLVDVSDSLILFGGIIVILIAILSFFSLIVQGYLSFKYFRFNRKQNSCGKTGEEVAREILDANGLNNIKVKSSGSILFGNSYSHFFKKVRLRRLTWRKKSVSSLAMASQKSCLAILDKENDPDMKTRIMLTPFIYFGPLFCIPLVIFGLLLDIIIFNCNSATFTIICSLIGLITYVISFVMSIKILRTEVKAQNRAYEVLRNSNLANEEELNMLQELFKLYNIEYINNMIASLLELVYRVLQIVIYIQQNNKKSN